MIGELRPLNLQRLSYEQKRIQLRKQQLNKLVYAHHHLLGKSVWKSFSCRFIVRLVN